MIIYFGLAFDDPVFPDPATPAGGTHYFGPQGLLFFLESHLGLIGHPADNDYLRIEQYRQVLSRYLADHPTVFYRAAFEADQFATAIELLDRRDELRMAGWDFMMEKELPPRLEALAAIEALITSGEYSVAAGWADRMEMVVEALEQRSVPIQKIYHREAVDLLPPIWKRLFLLFTKQGTILEEIATPTAEGQTDLARFQRALTEVSNEKKAPQDLRGDGTLLILRGKRETDLAAFTAQLLQRNKETHPLCLIPDRNRTLDDALIQEGLPSLGIAPASLARPTLQVLKLVTVFLWNPIDPFKIMEFVSLATKPLEEELAYQIAAQIAQTPGVKGDGWNAMIGRYFKALEERVKEQPSLDVEAIKYQYRFWFERKRFDQQQQVPKEEVLDIFQYLTRWAYAAFEDSGSENSSLLILSEQARKVFELLRALPEDELTHLELERIVRTIYEAAPAQLVPAQQGHYPYIHHPTAMVQATRQLLWWNFSQQEPDHFFSRWYGKERQYLEQRGCRLATPVSENALLIWQRKQAVQFTRQQIILVLPEKVNGNTVYPYPLYSDLEAHFANLEACVLDIDQMTVPAAWAQAFTIPGKHKLEKRMLGKPKPFLKIEAAERLEQRPEETYSSLDALFYYPYKWVFRYKIRLRKSPILSVVSDHTLLGNLAHRFFEELLKQDIQKMTKAAVEQWVDQEKHRLLEREGAVLLMYGREPERVSFIQRIKFSAWSLVELIQRNNWEVEGIEQPLQGTFEGVPVQGRADLVLRRGKEQAVIDLKWRGASYRERIIRNEEDLQLVLYSRLLTNGDDWAHTAFFIMENGRMIARNELAFDQIRAISKDDDHTVINERILSFMKHTYQWRINQIKAGTIEIRCAQTQGELDEEYGADLLDMLEMKTEDAAYDDYRTLINLVD
jgi:ATP-dependent helicase/nuclease subunit B